MSLLPFSLQINHVICAMYNSDIEAADDGVENYAN